MAPHNGEAYMVCGYAELAQTEQLHSTSVTSLSRQVTELFHWATGLEGNVTV